MLGGGDITLQPEIQRVVRHQVGGLGLQHLLDDGFVVVVLQDLDALPDRLPEPFKVSGVVLEVVIVQLGLDVGVGGCNLKVTGAVGQLQDAGEPDSLGLQGVARDRRRE